MTLPAAAARAPAAIDRCLLPAPELSSKRDSRTYGATNGRTEGHETVYIDPALDIHSLNTHSVQHTGTDIQ